MILKYGSYIHADAECAVVITKRPEYSPRGVRKSVRETWTIAGVMQANSQSELTAALAALRSAYNVNGQDVGLYLGDGTTLSNHFMNSGNALGGVRVTAFDFPKGEGAEYSTFRSYSITLEADFPDTFPNLLDYHEAISFKGTGGRRKVFLETLDGPPQMQIAAQRTTYKATQKGKAVGAGTWPAPSAPLWPFAELEDHRTIDYDTPRVAGRHVTELAVSWNYAFESVTPLVGMPTLR